MDIDTQKVLIEEDETKLSSYWKLRNVRIEADQSIINLDKSPSTTDAIKWKSNDPKVFFDTSRSLVSVYPPRFRLPITMNFSPEEKDNMNKAERLAIGIWRTLDKQRYDTGGVSWLWDLAYWVLLGWWAVFNVVEKTGDGIEFTADIWNPCTVYPKWDASGLVKCVRSYEVDNTTAQTMAEDFASKGLKFIYQESDKTGRARVINWWAKDNKKVYNAIMLNGEIVKPITLQKQLSRIPIQIGAIGIPDKTVVLWEQRLGESIIASNRDMYEYSDIMVSLMATIMAETAYPNIITKTRSGIQPFKAEDLKGFGAQISLKLEDQIELLKHAATPQEANILIQMFEQAKQKGSVPNVVYGNLPMELSGFAISQLMAAIKYKLGPYLNALQYIISNVMSDFFYQYRTGNYGKITLSTENTKDLKRGQSYIEEFSKQDVPKHIYVEVTIPITSQFDKTQQILNANQALQSRLLSRETLWETELDIQDTEAEKERIREDQVFDDPFIQGIEIIEAMWRKVEQYNVEGKLMQAEALKRYIMLKEMELGMRQGIPQKAGAPGVPPQQMPPEAGMSPSPDQMNAMAGKGTPGLARRPQTPEERAANKGRKGVLFSPSGETLI